MLQATGSQSRTQLSDGTAAEDHYNWMDVVLGFCCPILAKLLNLSLCFSKAQLEIIIHINSAMLMFNKVPNINNNNQEPKKSSNQIPSFYR